MYSALHSAETAVASHVVVNELVTAWCTEAVLSVSLRNFSN